MSQRPIRRTSWYRHYHKLRPPPVVLGTVDLMWGTRRWHPFETLVKLAHRFIATTISGRKESTNRVTEIDLYYLYCIYTEGVVCNILYWLDRYLKSVRDKSLIHGRMFVTRIAQSFGLLTNEMRDALSVEPPPHIFKKKSLIAMGVIMELQNKISVWPVTRAAVEDDEAKEEAKGEAANMEAGGSTEM
ncbi:hypothetical protein Tco_0257308 [Tanacetum coccineum]